MTLVAIRFRWIWVEKFHYCKGSTDLKLSQSAFAGYGLKSNTRAYVCWVFTSRNPLSLDMGWKESKDSQIVCCWWCRNPLSLDMGWKETQKPCRNFPLASQSAFAGYGLKSSKWVRKKPIEGGVAIRFRWIWVEKKILRYWTCLSRSRNPLSLDMGWKVRMWILSDSNTLSQSAFAGYGLKRWRRVLGREEANTVAIRFRWIWVEKEFYHIKMSHVL